MRHTRLARILAAAMLTALVLPQAVLAAPTAAATLPEIKLGCALVVPNPLTPTAPNRAIVCRWTAPDAVAVKSYRVWRTVDAGTRRLVATVATNANLRHADRNIRTGHVYRYTVVGIGADGARVAKSATVAVRVGRPAEPLRFTCVLAIDAGQPAVGCRWSDTTRASAVRYVLWRSVNGAAREAIYRTGEDGRRSFVDRAVKPGQAVRYAVVALDGHGRIVAYGGPDRVVIAN